MYCRFAIGVISVWVGSACALVTAEPLSPETGILARESRPASYQVDFRVSITPPANAKKLRVWLPLPPSVDGQVISETKIETFPRRIGYAVNAEPDFGNRFAYFEFDRPQGAQLITHQFKATINQLDWDVDYLRVRRPTEWPDSFARYQDPDPRSAESDQLRQVLDEIKSSSVGASETRGLIGAIRWIDQNLSYDHNFASLSADPQHALVHRRGHCSDYHGLCSTLARSLGYPSRVSYGLKMFDSASPSHCKMEIFLPPYGWVRYDLSETQKLAQKSDVDTSQQVRARTMRGFSENTWLLVTRGVNYELAPKASKPVHIVRTIYAEADGEPLTEPDPSNAEQRSFSWMTMYRVDEIGGSSQRFDDLE